MKIHPHDNVEVRENGKKYALANIPKGENIIKYGFPIGHAAKDIGAGDKVDENNVRSNISGTGEWSYEKRQTTPVGIKSGSFLGYPRKNGEVGIRNELWIVPTVGCINDVAEALAKKHGAKALTHPYGCSQLGGDLDTTRAFLCGLIKHPNAGGVLVLGLGCENNVMDRLKEQLGEYDEERVAFIVLQEVGDEMAECANAIAKLKAVMAGDKRVPTPISKLRIGVKCGGSDGYSGITANPLVGRTSELFGEYGASVLMTELPEAFGAEQLLLSGCKSEEIFNEASQMIRRFRRYYIDHGEGIADNPSPGNIAGGISTLEEKSLGCVQKAGRLPLCGVLEFGESSKNGGGLYLVNGPGNDMVAVTALAASHAHIILFTTGRGTPLASVVPTVKISTNTALAEKKPHWIDFDAGVMLSGVSREELADKLYEKCVKTAEGEATKSESLGYYGIAIFKDGVTL